MGNIGGNIIAFRRLITPKKTVIISQFTNTIAKLNVMPYLNPATLNTILNTAPMIIQGAGKLIKLIRDRENVSNTAENEPTTLESLKAQVANLELRLTENSKSDVEQIQLIEELARQNESLAETLKQTLRRVTILNVLVLLAITTALAALLLN